MTLQEQCCTAEQGKRLVELGVKAPAVFWHMPEKSHLHKKYIRYTWHSDAIAPAFTVAELGNMLPEQICCDKATTCAPVTIPPGRSGKSARSRSLSRPSKSCGNK